jgi:RNA polymerase sigma-70 factor (ECF subfamily)
MGNKELTRLYDEHAQSLYAFLCYRTGDPVLAEDLLSDTFERAVRAARGYDRRKAAERTWLYAIALNCARDSFRRTKAESRALVRVGADEGAAQFVLDTTELERRDALHQALATLNPYEREVLALRFGADLTLQEIAGVLGEPRSKIEARLYRGLKKLRDCLGPDF